MTAKAKKRPGDEDAIDDAALLVNDAALALILGVTRRTVHKLVQSGMPKRGRGAYYLPDVVQWQMARKLEDAAPNSTEFEELRREHIAAQTEKLNLENARARRELVPVEDHQDVVNRLAVTFASQLDALGGRLAHDLAGMADPGLIHETLTNEARAIRATTADIVENWSQS